MKYTLNTDGGARGNPGPAGIGYVICDANGETLREGKEYIGEVTNNFAEYRAVLEGLLALKKIIPKEKRKEAQVVLKLDSELVAKQLRHDYQVQEETLFPLFIAIHNIRIKDFSNLEIIHVPREQNAHADKLVNEAIDEALNKK